MKRWLTTFVPSSETLRDAVKSRQRLFSTAALCNPHRKAVAKVGQEHLAFIQQLYSNSTVDVENEGHTYGHELSPADKQALIAFLATL